MITKILAVDIGFGSTGMAVVAITPGGQPELYTYTCLHTKPEHKRRGIYVAHDDVRRAMDITRGIRDYYMLNGCAGLAVELPSGGAQGAKANRAMGIATGLVAALAEVSLWPVEWITPGESRKAAIGRETAPKGQDVKELVINAMAAKYGATLAALKVMDKEHVADALATFEAAQARQMVRTLAGVANV